MNVCLRLRAAIGTMRVTSNLGAESCPCPVRIDFKLHHVGVQGGDPSVRCAIVAGAAQHCWDCACSEGVGFFPPTTCIAGNYILASSLLSMPAQPRLLLFWWALLIAAPAIPACLLSSPFPPRLCVCRRTIVEHGGRELLSFADLGLHCASLTLRRRCAGLPPHDCANHGGVPQSRRLRVGVTQTPFFCAISQGPVVQAESRQPNSGRAPESLGLPPLFCYNSFWLWGPSIDSGRIPQFIVCTDHHIVLRVSPRCAHA